MGKIIKTLARRRFNYIDATGMVVYMVLITDGHVVLACVVLFFAIVLSVIAELEAAEQAS